MSAKPPNHVFKLRLSPVVRLGMAFGEDLSRDKGGTLVNLKAEFLARFVTAEAKRDQIVKAAFLLDGLILLIHSGQQFALPLVGGSLSKLPVILELTTIASAVSIAFASLQFVTCGAYDMILRQYSNLEAGPTLAHDNQGVRYSIDPDLVSAARSYNELSLKVLRPKLNLSGADYYVPTMAFRVFAGLCSLLVAILFILIPIGHGSLIYLSLYATYAKFGVSFLAVIYYCIVVSLHLLALLICVGSYKEFDFDVDLSEPPWISRPVVIPRQDD